jgi:hypothetical protein
MTYDTAGYHCAKFLRKGVLGAPVRFEVADEILLPNRPYHVF